MSKTSMRDITAVKPQKLTSSVRPEKGTTHSNVKAASVRDQTGHNSPEDQLQKGKTSQLRVHNTREFHDAH